MNPMGLLKKMTLPAIIGIIFGSNIGTTTGAWLMASYGVEIDLATYALPTAVFGILFIYQKDGRLKGGGRCGRERHAGPPDPR